MFYHDVAQYAANMMRNSDWNIYHNIQQYSVNVQFSDMGYPIYLTFAYWIFGNSVFIVRVIKAVLSAWTVILMYRLATRNFDEQTGRMVAIMSRFSKATKTRTSPFRLTVTTTARSL